MRLLWGQPRPRAFSGLIEKSAVFCEGNAAALVSGHFFRSPDECGFQAVTGG